MEGIHFVTDENGKKVAAQIDLELYGEMWEDFYDQLVAEDRKNDKRLPLSEVKKRLVKAGKLRG
jgi:hypothetical protein